MTTTGNSYHTDDYLMNDDKSLYNIDNRTHAKEFTQNYLCTAGYKIYIRFYHTSKRNQTKNNNV